MTAAGITVVTIDIPNPDVVGYVPPVKFEQVNANLSFSFTQSGNVRTLSCTDATPGNDISGLLYSPAPSSTSGCSEYLQYVPANATHVIIPRSTFVWIAVAPWISANCTLAYLEAVQMDPIRAFVFYLPDNGTSIPPVADSPVWGLGDGGRWKTLNKFPVYAIPSISGQHIISELALYSGNLTSVPNGHQLANIYAPSDYIRLAMEIGILAGSESLPSLWVFLLIVLGILIFIIGSTSFVMHWLQRKRRERLRRRVANGEVDLEALGIRRLTVPQEVLAKMPLYTYASTTGTPNPTVAEVQSVKQEQKPNSSAGQSRSFSQPTCAICLDDFVDQESLVRELPCGHIFHSDCIDSFLRQNSSLCPMCKKTVLPRGYCPSVITNAMVRRERMIRRIREREPRAQSSAMRGTLPRRGFRAVFSRVRAAASRTSNRPPPGSGASEQSGGMEMDRRSRSPVASSPAEAPPAVSEGVSPQFGQECAPSPEPQSPPADAGPQRTEAQSRREWARQRALAMLGHSATAEDDAVAEEELRRPRWRRIAGWIWPGVG